MDAWKNASVLQEKAMSIKFLVLVGGVFLDVAFLLTVGSFLLTVELFHLQLTILAFLLTVGVFLLTV